RTRAIAADLADGVGIRLAHALPHHRDRLADLDHALAIAQRLVQEPAGGAHAVPGEELLLDRRGIVERARPRRHVDVDVDARAVGIDDRAPGAVVEDERHAARLAHHLAPAAGLAARAELLDGRLVEHARALG